MTFEIVDCWKGRTGKKITFKSYSYNPQDENGEKIRFIDSLTYEFTVGKTYFVYANVNLDGFSASACGRTTELEKAGRDIEELNSLRQKEIAIVPPPKSFSPFVAPFN